MWSYIGSQSAVMYRETIDGVRRELFRRKFIKFSNTEYVVPELSKKQAENLLACLNSLTSEQSYDLIRKNKEKVFTGVRTLHMALDEYIGLKTGVSNSIKNSASRVNILKSIVPDIPLDQITLQKVMEWDKKLRERTLVNGMPVKQGTAHQYMKELKSFIALALQLEWMSHDPLQRVRRGQLVTAPKDGRLVFWTSDECAAIIDKCEDTQSATKLEWQIGFSLMAWAGLRIGEAQAIRFEHLNLSQNQIELTPEITKTKTARIIPIHTKRLLPLLQQLKKQSRDALLIPGFGNMSQQKINVRLKTLCKGMEFEKGGDVFSHRFRHSYASGLARKGVQLIFIKDLLGHRDIKSTMIYAQLLNRDLHRAVELL